MRDPLTEEKDRRRSPRFLCGGHAMIASLPSEGMLASGKLSDLSLSGCGIRTAMQLEHGARAEIVIRVNASSFRALTQVRAIRESFGIGVEFLQLSSSGKNMLDELLHELARQNAIASTLRISRQEPDREQLAQGVTALLNLRLPVVAIINSEGASDDRNENASASDRPSPLIVDGNVDLFL